MEMPNENAGLPRGGRFGGRLPVSVLVMALVSALVVLSLWGCADERIGSEMETETAPTSSEGTGLEGIDWASDTSSSEGVLRTTPETVDLGECGNLSFNASVSVPQAVPSPSVPVVVRDFAADDEKVAQAVLGKSAKLVKSESYLENGDEDDVYEVFADGQGAELYLFPGSLAYNAGDREKFSDALVYQPYSRRVDPYPLVTAVEDGNVASVEGMAGQFLAQLSAGSFSNPTTFSLTAQALNESRRNFLQDMAEDGDGLSIADAFDEADAFWSIFVQQEVGDVPLTAISSLIASNEDSGRPASTVIRIDANTDGVLSADLSGLYKAVDGDGGRSDAESGGQVLLPLEEAIKILCDRYNRAQSNDVVPIDRIALEYCPVYDGKSSSGISLVPAWTFRIANTSDQGFFVDAFTGDLF